MARAGAGSTSGETSLAAGGAANTSNLASDTRLRRVVAYQPRSNRAEGHSSSVALARSRAIIMLHARSRVIMRARTRGRQSRCAAALRHAALASAYRRSVHRDQQRLRQPMGCAESTRTASRAASRHAVGSCTRRAAAHRWLHRSTSAFLVSIGGHRDCMPRNNAEQHRGLGWR